MAVFFTRLSFDTRKSVRFLKKLSTKLDPNVMDMLNNDSEHIFSLPVALIFQNDSGLDENSKLVYDSTPSIGAVERNHSWKKEIFANGPQRLEKIGDTLRRELKWAFILHTYGFGCLFFILAFYTFFSVLNIRSFISSRPFMSTINGFLCLLGTSRAASLFIDPYNLNENMPKLMGQMLWDLGFPSIISAFCLVQLAFLQLTQLQIGPEGLRRKSCLSLIITAHFLLTIGMDIVIASHENWKTVKHVIQYVFLTWGVFLCSNFLYSGYKVMSMIRSMPGGLKHRDLPDPSYKGIMQLAILAPHNNLAGSMTAALLPTLCTPKIHQQDNVSLSAVGFRNEGNSRILESESIPMLEEMAVSSGDEVSPKPLARGTSFQNQTRNSQKFNLKPKLSLRSVEDSETKDELSEQKSKGGQKSPKSPSLKNQSPKLSSGKTSEFDFTEKSNNGILKHTEHFVTTRSINEFKSKIQQRNSFENENFHFPNSKKTKSNENSSKSETAQPDNFVPDILVSCPTDSKCNQKRKGSEKKESGDKAIAHEGNQKNINKIMHEITEEFNEMQIVREGKGEGTEEVNEIRKSKREKGQDAADHQSEGKKESGVNDFDECRKDSCKSRRSSQKSEEASGRNSCRKGNLVWEAEGNEESLSSAVTEIAKLEEAPVASQKSNRRRKTMKSLSWKKREANEEEEENATQECLLPQENLTDVSLRSVLNHIAYMNRGAPTNVSSEDELEKVRKSKVEWVLNITYITAMWGLMLCLSNMGRIYSPFEVPESREVPSSTSNTSRIRTVEANENIFFSSWPWLWFQTFCRALELAMGCAMANITRQPTANHRYPRAMSLRHRDTFYSI